MAKRISAIFFLTVIFSAFAVLCVRFSAGGADGLTLTLRALVDGEVSAQLEEAAGLPRVPWALAAWGTCSQGRRAR